MSCQFGKMCCSCTLKTERDAVLVSVRDLGSRLEPATLERLFEAFYAKPSGMVMGLSICRPIIEAHGGRLWAGANPPLGAIFELSLPTYPNLANQPVVVSATPTRWLGSFGSILLKKSSPPSGPN